MNKKSYLTAQYFLNHKLDIVEIKKHIVEFAQKGYQGIFAHARQGLLTPYMSEEWWMVIDEIVKLCETLGVEFWIWDEDYFPSGLAGGRIAWEYPELKAKNLNFKTEIFEDAKEIEFDFSDGYLLKAYALELNRKDECVNIIDISNYCGTRRGLWTRRGVKHTMYSPLLAMSGNPHWRCSFVDNRFAVYWRPPKLAKYVVVGITVNYAGQQTDLLDSRTTRHLLKITYEEYFSRFRKYFSNTVKGAFFDEPSPCSDIYPWTKSFPEEFKKDHGYDIIANLAHLAWDIDDRSPAVRLHFRQTQHRLQSQSYLCQTYNWCRQKKILFTGHLTRTEWLSLNAALWPNELRSYKYMDIPCCDPLGKAYGWKDSSPYHTGIKVVSSAAHIFGKKQAGSDCLAVIGDEVCIRDIKGMLDYQMALGINFFVVHGFSYSTDGPRKDEVPPSLFYQHSEWNYMNLLAEHVKKTCEKLTDAEHFCKILMLYPSTSLACLQKPDKISLNFQENSWCNLTDEKKIHALVETMLSHHKDFDFIDEITLHETVNSDGQLSLKEPYELIVLPYLKYIGEDAACALKKFSSAGGKVICAGSIPAVIPRDLQKTLHKLSVKNMVHIDQLNEEEIIPLLPNTADIAGSGLEDVFITSYRKNGVHCYFAYNRSENVFIGKINGREVELYGKSGMFVNGREKPQIKRITAGRQQIIELNTDWNVVFENNHIPLSFWHVFTRKEMMNSDDMSQCGTFDLMNREGLSEVNSDGAVIYRNRFMVSGTIARAGIIMEEEAISGDWELLVNGEKIENWHEQMVFDCENIVADISGNLKSANSPVVNTIDIAVAGGEIKLREMPYLFGSFRCLYPHGHKSFPLLTGAADDFNLEILSDWATLGYPTYSGTASYDRTIDIARAGEYIIDLGRVEDIAEILIDGKPAAVLPWPPYRHSLKLAKGKHKIEIKVTNGPGNRYRFAGLSAGLMGPVKITQI